VEAAEAEAAEAEAARQRAVEEAATREVADDPVFGALVSMLDAEDDREASRFEEVAAEKKARRAAAEEEAAEEELVAQITAEAEAAGLAAEEEVAEVSLGTPVVEWLAAHGAEEYAPLFAEEDAETLEDVTYLCSERADFLNLGVDEERTDILWAALQVSSTDSQLTVN
jgi:hypothetical protein